MIPENSRCRFSAARRARRSSGRPAPSARGVGARSCRRWGQCTYPTCRSRRAISPRSPTDVGRWLWSSRRTRSTCETLASCRRANLIKLSPRRCNRVCSSPKRAAVRCRWPTPRGRRAPPTGTRSRNGSEDRLVPAEAPVDVPDMIYRAAEYEAHVARLRGLGCRCPLRCEVYGVGVRAGVRATPLNGVVAAMCTVDHQS